MKNICSLFLLITYCSTASAGGIASAFKKLGRVVAMRADTDTLVRKQSFSAGVSYGSDASFFGRTSPNKYPYFTADAIYNAKSGLFVYGSVWNVLASAPTLDEIDVGGGYAFRIRKFASTLSYTHFFINKDAKIIKSSSANDVEFKNTFDWRFAKTSVALDYLFGKASDIFLSIGTSKYIETSFGIFDDTDYLSFNPAINVIFGTQNFVEHYSDNERYNRNPGDGYAFERDTYLTASKNRVFNPLNYSLKVPIAYNRAHYTLEASWKYSIPVNVEGPILNHNTTFFNLTFYYIFY